LAITAAGVGGLELSLTWLCYRLLTRRERTDASSFDLGYDAGYDDCTREMDPTAPQNGPAELCQVIPLHRDES
jgi:hypothetical protein